MQPLMIVWQDAYMLDIPILDEQHHGIGSLLNTLYYLMSNNHGRGALIPVLSALEIYAKVHFFTEEHLLAAARYANTADHVAEHRRLSFMLQESMSATKLEEDTEKLMHFVRALWLAHINKHDRSFVPAVKKYLRLA